MTPHETKLFSEISAYVSRNPGIVMRCGLEDFITEIFFRISPFEIDDAEIAEILLKPSFQAMLADANIALWIGRSDRQIRLVDQVPHWPPPLRIGPPEPHCAFCLMPEAEPKIELAEEIIGTNRLQGSFVHKRCRRAMRQYRELAEARL